MSLFIEGIGNYRAAVSELPDAVQAWMWFMRALLMGGSLVFILTRPGAIVFAVMIGNALLLWAGMALYPTALHMIGPTLHLILWSPLVFYLLRYFRITEKPSDAYLRAAHLWLIVAIVVMAISLLLDAVALLA